MQVLVLMLLISAANTKGEIDTTGSKKLTGENLDTYRAEVKFLQQESWGEPDKNVGEMLSQLTPGQGPNPDEMGSYMEGDMLIITPENILGNRFAEIDSRFRWPDGIVYYAIDGNYNSEQRDRILKGIAEFHKHTCIRFEPYTGREKDYILIQSKSTGCWSALGRTGGKQIVNLQPPGCVSQIGVGMHELMHALGIFHEQSRTDRDDFVNIAWQNIEPGKEHNFKQHKYFGLGLKYDYGSLMHYSITAFSRNKQPTIDTKYKSFDNIGQRKGFSEGDIEKINRLYNCNSHQQKDNSIDDQSNIRSIINPARKTIITKPNPHGMNRTKLASKLNPGKLTPNKNGIKQVQIPTKINKTQIPKNPVIPGTLSQLFEKSNQGKIDQFIYNKNGYVKVNSIKNVEKVTVDPLNDWLNKYEAGEIKTKKYYK